MDKKIIIAVVQSGNVNFATEQNVFVPMTNEQWAARKDSFIAGLKQNMFKLQKRFRVKGAAA